MNILVLQHVSGDTGGSFLRFLPGGGAALTIVIFERGDALPALEAFDAMLVLGGRWMFGKVDLHPWMIGEKRAIRRFVRRWAGPISAFALGTNCWPTHWAAPAGRRSRNRWDRSQLN